MSIRKKYSKALKNPRTLQKDYTVIKSYLEK